MARRGEIGRNAPPRYRHVESSVRPRARFFLAETLAFHVVPALIRARRGGSSFFTAGACVGAGALPPFVAFVRRGGFAAAGAGILELAGSAISNPNKAAT